MEYRYALPEIGQAARWVWQALGRRRVMALHGAMGAGKTTLVHALCEAKGVKDAVTSPTFSIINEYGWQEEGRPVSMYHIDLYRLSGEAEAIQAGVEDCIYSGHYCLVEWPEKAPGLFPADTLHVYLEAAGDDERRLVIRDI